MRNAISCAIRAMQSRSLLGAIRELPVATQREIFRNVEPTLITQIDGAIGMSWVPMGAHMRVSDEARLVLGQERFVTLFERSMMRSWDSPLLSGFVKMSTTLLGLTPRSLVQRAPYVYTHVTRDLGSLTSEFDGPKTVVSLLGFPAEFFNFQCYVDGTFGCLRSVFALTQTHGEVTVLDMDATRGACRYQLRW
jgi:hypothetical protein